MADLKTSTASKEDLKKALITMEAQTSAVTKLKDDILTEAGKYASDVATTGYTDTSKLKDDIKALVDRALQVCPPLLPQQKAKSEPWTPELTLWLRVTNT